MSVTTQVNTQNVVLSEPQRSSSRNFNVTDRLPWARRQATAGNGATTSNVREKNSGILTGMQMTKKSSRCSCFILFLVL